MSIPEQTAQEDIERGLARLNVAWQALKKAKEAHQHAQDLYETFYAWLQERASFSLDTITNVYKLEANGTNMHELKKNIPPVQEEIDTKIAAMNQAEYDYDHAETPEAEKEADKRFSACWDWFIENKVPFYRDTEERVYRYGKKLP